MEDAELFQLIPSIVHANPWPLTPPQKDHPQEVLQHLELLEENNHYH
jgi:hypothetical protein